MSDIRHPCGPSVDAGRPSMTSRSGSPTDPAKAPQTGVLSAHSPDVSAHCFATWRPVDAQWNQWAVQEYCLVRACFCVCLRAFHPSQGELGRDRYGGSTSRARAEGALRRGGWRRKQLCRLMTAGCDRQQLVPKGPGPVCRLSPSLSELQSRLPFKHQAPCCLRRPQYIRLDTRS